jgi:hypothetical protein
LIVVAASREGSHYENKDALYDKLKSSKYSFFDIISPRDRTEENFGIYGPYIEGHEYEDQPKGITIKHGAFYFI